MYTLFAYTTSHTKLLQINTENKTEISVYLKINQIAEWYERLPSPAGNPRLITFWLLSIHHPLVNW
jgi:hypothetical protein